ncbi:MAG: hypothetical protein FWC91_11115 [Defluviitaleaceae bacterium]|nr:hypothetical protein [Defluviitaleaceae bacterium]
MEPNDNNPRPEGSESYDAHYFPPERRRTKKRKIIIPVIIVLFLGMILASTSVGRHQSGDRGSARHTSVQIVMALENDTAVVTETISVIAVENAEEEALSILEELPHLSVIDSVGLAGSLRIPIADVDRLYVNTRHSSIQFVIHNEDSEVILIRSPQSINYDLNRSRGILNVTGNHQTFSIYVPHSHFEAIFEYVTISGRHNHIALTGSDDENTFLSQNLSVRNTHGAIILSNIIISGQLDIENSHSNINIHNVIADSDRLNITNPHGRVFVS